MEISKSPAPFVPAWARDFFDDWRKPSRPHLVSIDDETPPDLPHRRAAFYALLCSNRPDMREFWEHAECLIRKECDRRSFSTERELRWFLSRLILATDEVCDDERYAFDRSRRPTLPRLRDPLQNLARKVVCQIRELNLITPRRLISGAPLRSANASEVVDGLVNHYQLILPPMDYYWVFRNHQIEFTMSSKRGWVQHVQAAEKLRQRLTDNLRQLASKTTAAPAFMRMLWHYADILESAPTIDVLSVGEPVLASQKASWADWLRTLQAWYAVDGEIGIVDALPKSDWATLVSVLFGEAVAERNIRQIMSR